jgi:septal ring factor EnvC (AmiA/AmiB activator)
LVAAPGGPHLDPLDHSRSAPARPAGRSALFWGISGGTILSIVGFIAMLLFEQYNDSLTELRNDLKHFNEISGDLVKKERLRRCIDHLKKCIEELQQAKAARARVERELQNSENERKELTRELQRLHERVAAVEGRQAATPIIIQSPPRKGEK